MTNKAEPVLTMDDIRAALAANNLDGFSAQATLQLAGFARTIEAAVRAKLNKE